MNGTTTEYFLNGTQILAQKTGSDVMWFFYDSQGQRIGLVYNDYVYYYVYNLQGDVIALARAATGQIVARYAYDAWGNCTVTNATGYDIGTKNPFRYRGYYYDAETGLYYLNSRYYNPSWGRFINADIFVSTGQGVLGSNMFAYCGNNPVMGYDPTGTWVIGIMGGSVSGGFGVGGSIGVMTIFDGKGNVAEVVIGYYGGGTPNVGASIDFLTYSSAEDIFQFVYGYSICVGGSYEFASLDVCLGSDMDGNAFAGFTISGGVSAAPAELHAGIGFAQITELIMYEGQFLPLNPSQDFFADMDPRVRKMLLNEAIGSPTHCCTGGGRIGCHVQAQLLM